MKVIKLYTGRVPLQMIFLLILVIYPVISICAQYQDIWYNNVSISPSPNPSAFAKYGDIPVDKSTGVPGISIPVLSIQSGGVTLPVNLSYHAGGIQVQENASWIGLGWVIHCGGVISRRMRGRPDEGPGGFLEISERVPNQYIIDHELSTPGLNNNTYEMLKSHTIGYIDYEPDQFCYSFNNHSGSFFFSNNKEPVIIPSDMLQIQVLYGQRHITGFKITDSDGIIYYFGDFDNNNCTEHTSVNVKGADPSPFTSSWYLNKIVNPGNNSEINFSYSSFNYTASVNYSQTRHYELVGASYLPSGGLKINPCITTIPDAKFLEKIAFDNGNVIFCNSASNDGGRKLDSILWTNYVSKRKYIFNYDYFKSKRLKLLSFNAIGSNEKLEYSFIYNETELPERNSNAQDYWGYYNGHSNTNLIPQVFYAGQTFGNAIRSPDLKYTKACVLTKIIYPTGGSTTFDYELNTYARAKTIDDICTKDSRSVFVSGSGAHYQLCKTSSPIFFNSAIASFEYSFDDYISSLNFHNGGMSSTLIKDEYRQIEFTDIHLNASLSISDPASYSASQNYGLVYLVDNNEQTTTLISRVTYGQPVSKTLTGMDFTHSYSIKVCAFGAIATTWAEITYKQYDPDDLAGTVDEPSGGLRIKKLTNYDPFRFQSDYTMFDYKGNGYLTQHPADYYTLTKRITYNESGGVEEFPGIMIYSSPPGGGENRVAYKKVTEYYGTLENNSGKTETYLYITGDEGHGGKPYLPQISNSWMRSKVISQQLYEFDNTTQNYRKVSQKDFNYVLDSYHHHEIKGFKATRIQNNGDVIALRDYQNDFFYENFTINANWLKLISETTSDFPKNSQPLVIRKSIYYDNPLHMLPTRIEYINAKGDEVQIINKYSSDYTSCGYICNEDYQMDVDRCKLSLSESYQEISDVRLKYGQCFAQYLENYAAMNSEIDSRCNDHTIGSLIHFRSLSLPCMGKVINKWDLEDKMHNCLINNGYYTALNDYNCSYLQCAVEANLSFKRCKDEFVLCLANEYSKSQGALKGTLFMAGHNIINPLIEKVTRVNKIETDHINWNYEVKDSFSLVLNSIERTLVDGTLISEISYNEYDHKNNPLEITEKGAGMKKSFIWGYKYSLPIVEVSNAEAGHIYYEGFEDNTTADSINVAHTGRKFMSGHFKIPFKPATNQDSLILTYWYWDESEWRYSGEIAFSTDHIIEKQRIDDIRIYPRGAQMKTFTYDPHIGMTSLTDPNGITTFYDYDSLGRLKAIKDDDGNILKTYEYHYKQ